MYPCMFRNPGNTDVVLFTRSGVEDKRLEAKDTKKFRGQGQGQPFRGKALPRPRTGVLEAKDTGASVLRKKLFQAISKKKSSKKFWLVLEFGSRGFYVQAYADDLAVLVTGADML